MFFVIKYINGIKEVSIEMKKGTYLRIFDVFKNVIY